MILLINKIDHSFLQMYYEACIASSCQSNEHCPATAATAVRGGVYFKSFLDSSFSNNHK
jgi:hypothetical protein